MSCEITGTRWLGLQQLIGRVKAGYYFVKVGVLKDAGNEKDKDGKDLGVSLATVAVANNFGVPGHIPERRFMQVGLERGAPFFKRLNAANLRLVVAGRQAMPTVLGQLGAAGAGAIKDAIKHSRELFVKNADSTIARKDSDQPLKDSGNLEQAITWQVPT